jgi:predicted Zn-dependent protease
MAHEIAHVSQRHYSRSQEAFKGKVCWHWRGF